MPIIDTKKTIRFGVLKNKIKIAKDFDAPLSDDFLNDFEVILKQYSDLVELV